MLVGFLGRSVALACANCSSLVVSARGDGGGCYYSKSQKGIVSLMMCAGGTVLPL